MRAYEFAKKVGATYAAVVKLAEANDVEVYSPLTQFEPDEVEALNAAFLKADRASLQAEAAQVAEKRRSKAAKALSARVAHDRQQFDELEAGRKRALEAAGLKDYAQPAAMNAPEMPVAVPDVAPAPEAASAKKAEKPAPVATGKTVKGFISLITPKSDGSAEVTIRNAGKNKGVETGAIGKIVGTSIKIEMTQCFPTSCKALVPASANPKGLKQGADVEFSL